MNTTTMTPQQFAAAVDAMIANVTDVAADSKELKGKRDNGSDQLRDLALSSHAAGLPVGPAADYILLKYTAAGLKSTGGAYKMAFAGYRVAIDEGVNILSQGEKEKPMTAQAAQVFLKSPAERAKIQEQKDLLVELAKRGRALTLEALREAVASLPEAKKAAKPVQSTITLDSLLDAMSVAEAGTEVANAA